MERMITFQSWLSKTGMTGWILAAYFMAFAGPMPKTDRNSLY
jgi:hypothetical protein